MSAPLAARPVIDVSVVIPAHDEAAVIERCLHGMLAGADAAALRLDVVVVCNGCSDDTAARARRFGAPVRVLELPAAGKAKALAAGDANARAFPRFYVDADVVLSAAAIRAVAERLHDDSPIVVAAPRVQLELAARPWAVRAFYRTWTSLPFFGDGFVGAGVYALSARARTRFGAFPDLIADDGFVRLLARPDERCTVDGVVFRAWPPRRLRDVVRVMTRIRAGGRELRARCPELVANEITSPRRTLRHLLAQPRWHEALVYLAVMAAAELGARWLAWRRRPVPWAQDRSSRGDARSTITAAREGSPRRRDPSAAAPAPAAPPSARAPSSTVPLRRTGTP